MEILSFDASGSTHYSTSYWNAIENLTKSKTFDALLSWSNTCKRVKNVNEPREYGGTDPSSFMEYIIREFNKTFITKKYGKDAQLTLQVTTDGQIYDGNIQKCAQYLQDEKFPPLKQVTIHYIGNESSMNFGLNAIFGSVADLFFTVNDIDTTKKVPSVAELENYEDITSPEFISFLCSRVNNLKLNDFEAFDRLRKKLIAKIENKHKESSSNKPIQPRKYFETNDGAGLEKAIKDRLFGLDQIEYQTQKNKILACFDKISEITLADIRGRGNLKSNVLTKKNVVEKYDLPEDVVVQVEDSITFENIDEGKICVLVKFDQEALFKCDSKYVKNPFLIFQDEAIRDKLVKRFELHPLSIESVKKLTEGNDTKSPFTRDICRAFILGPSNMNEVNFNSIALATFFKSDQRNKIYGNKLIWNFIMLYLIKSHIDSTVKNDESVAWSRDELHPLVNAITKEFVLNDVLLYRLTLHITIGLPVERVPLYISLWYIICVAPFRATNSSRNILRYPGSSVLLDLFEDLNLQDRIPFDDVIRKRLRFRLKVWRLWNEMLTRSKDTELKLLTRAAYQNHCFVNGRVVLLSGSRPKDLPCPELVDGIPPSIVQNMWTTLTAKSKRFDKLNEDGNSLPHPKWKLLKDDKNEYAEVLHMQIDPETLRPSETCAITNKPACKCAGKFDVRSESFARMFSLYCAKYKKYPENADQLVLLHNRKRAVDNVSSRHIHKYLQHVFDIYQPIVKDMSCSEFVEKYNAIGDAKPKPEKKPELKKEPQPARKKGPPNKLKKKPMPKPTTPQPDLSNLSIAETTSDQEPEAKDEPKEVKIVPNSWIKDESKAEPELDQDLEQEQEASAELKDFPPLPSAETGQKKSKRRRRKPKRS